MVLTTLEGETAITAAKQALAQGQGNRDIMEMVATIMVYKFTQLFNFTQLTDITDWLDK
jgi:predicted transposase YdaD